MAEYTKQQILDILNGDRRFISADLTRLNFKDMDLNGADFTGALFTGSLFWNTNLSNAGLRDVDLTGFDLSNVNLTGADLTGANLAAVTFGDAPQLLYARLPDGKTYLPGMDLTVYTGPDDAIHITLYHDTNAANVHVKMGTPNRFGLRATSVHWLTNEPYEVLIHACDVMVTDDVLGQIAQRVISEGGNVGDD